MHQRKRLLGFCRVGVKESTEFLYNAMLKDLKSLTSMLFTEWHNIHTYRRGEGLQNHCFLFDTSNWWDIYVSYTNKSVFKCGFKLHESNICGDCVWTAVASMSG